MCGICGIVALTGALAPDAREILPRMNATLRHRGPDDEGFSVDERAALAMRRLSIIDLAGGHQPIANEDGSVRVVFNGEIYNFAELRAGLEERGHRFATRSDTEVLVHLYEEEGDGFLPRLNGMFAFALWDERRSRLLLARDRAGKKPLYHARIGDELVFGSEAKALLVHPRVSRRLDRAALRSYLAFEYVPAPQSIWEGMRKLPPGHRLVAEAGQIRIDRWWDAADRGEPPCGRTEAPGRVLETLERAVRRRLVADVPLGVFLSGGIDSSTIVGLMARTVDPRRIRTFAVGFEEPSFDESRHARRAAEYFGTDHHEERLSAAGMIDILPEMLGWIDEPLADGSLIPTYLLSRFTRRHVTVALGGDGGDELFLGYPTFQAHVYARWAARVPRLLMAAATAATHWLPTSFDDISFDFKARSFVRGLGFPTGKRQQVWMGSFSPAEIGALLTPEFGAGSDTVLDGLDDELAARRFRDPLEAVEWLHFRYYLSDDILAKVDRASMAASLEVRAPFLDPEVIALATSLPISWRMPRLRLKGLLREAVAGLLPADLRARRKKGFGIPIAAWLAGPLRERMERLLDPARLRAQGIFRPEPVTRLVEEHRSRRRNHRKPLWTLLLFQEWMERWSPTG